MAIGGNHLSDEHTLEYLRTERLGSASVKPRIPEGWIADGSKGIVDVARERARKILEQRWPTPLDEGVASRLREVIKDADRAFGAD